MMKKHTQSKALMIMNNGLFCGYPIHIRFFFVCKHSAFVRTKPKYWSNVSKRTNF